MNPPVSIASTDFGRLRQIAVQALFSRDPVGRFLFSELERATVIDVPAIPVVRLDDWVTFRVDDDQPLESRILVLPGQPRRCALHLSVLSPVGAALVGLRPGDRMPYSGIDGVQHVVTVESLEPPDGVISLTQRRSARAARPDDNHPNGTGPTAA
ncbi:GreA/GreB family elongation factor [Rhodopseudomonas sp. HC1]|uniref:GreA/GreB family elongation factor n=1 Tax=Rhodopseudomonas infernalis TaxID=2897386 RepID=UPI001EE79D50|nr:GreA/GreB family elongation factor [Rhodopseudomonas infernalis]MCG6206563.1 GreA/GreB family elongation factor [Rhodopseudomonas infernalis]